MYHGNFIPQIPNQLIRRYTKENEVVMEPFMGSGTTLFECEKLNRKYIGFDINPEMIEYVTQSMSDDKYNNNFYINYCNSLDQKEVDNSFLNANQKFNSQNVQFILMHPPYMDIVKFTENENDLSKINDIENFIKKFKIICENSLKYLDKNRYFAIVIGDVYKNSEVVPLGFYCMDMIKRNFKVNLKGTIIKNIDQISKDTKLFWVNNEPSVSKTGSKLFTTKDLSPDKLNIADNLYNTNELIKAVSQVIEKKYYKDISAQLISLLNYAKIKSLQINFNEKLTFTNNDLVVISKDYGEVLSSIGIMSNLNFSQVYFPKNSNEKLIDFYAKKISVCYPISVKSGNGSKVF